VATTVDHLSPTADDTIALLRLEVANLEARLGAYEQTLAAAAARERMYTHALS
jgi:uncharacterized small protein (DUF1192 family)